MTKTISIVTCDWVKCAAKSAMSLWRISWKGELQLKWSFAWSSRALPIKNLVRSQPMMNRVVSRKRNESSWKVLKVLALLFLRLEMNSWKFTFGYSIEEDKNWPFATSRPPCFRSWSRVSRLIAAF